MLRLDFSTNVAFPLSRHRLKKIAALLADDQKLRADCTVTVACLTRPRMAELNHDFRGKNKPTNVLSFPHAEPAATRRAVKTRGDVYLGDVALCMAVLRAEAKAQKKPLEHHVTHMIVHGVLHLLGLDHMNHRDADAMESIETALLAALGIPDPYMIPPRT